MAEEDIKQSSILENLRDLISKNTLLSNYLKGKQLLFAIPILILVLVVVFYFVFKSPSENNQTNLQNISSQKGLTYAPPKAEEIKKKKKKKKKIKYKIMFRGLLNDQLNQAVRELSINSIEFEIDQAGSKYDLSVDQQMYNEAKNLLAIKGIPSTTKKGFAIFDEASNLGATEFDKRIRLMRALSGEMELAISQFESIDDAQVKLVIPEQRLFDTETIPVTASILIRPSREHFLTDSVVYAIISLVSNGVESLDEKNISVVDTFGRVLSEGIFERISFSNKQSPLQKTQETTESSIISKENIADQIDFNEWLDLKREYEALYKKQAIEVLKSVLPDNSYQLSVNTDFLTVNNRIPEMKKIVVKIVVNKAFPNLNFNSKIKQTIFSSVANSIPYVKGRDSIVLTLEDLPIPDLNIIEEQNEDNIIEEQSVVENIDTEDKNTNTPLFINLIKYWPVLFSGIMFVAFIYLLIFAVKKVFFKKAVLDVESELVSDFVDDPSNDFGYKVLPLDSQVEINSGIPKSLWTSKTTELITTVEKSISENPELLSKLIDDIMKEEVING